MKIEKRIRALEARMIADPVILVFEDGRTRKLPGGNFLRRLLQGVCGITVLGAWERSELEDIRQCAGSKEPGGGHMVELLRCLLHAKADARGSVELVGS